MREIRESGTVRGEEGNLLTYSTVILSYSFFMPPHVSLLPLKCTTQLFLCFYTEILHTCGSFVQPGFAIYLGHR